MELKDFQQDGAGYLRWLSGWLVEKRLKLSSWKS